MPSSPARQWDSVVALTLGDFGGENSGQAIRDAHLLRALAGNSAQCQVFTFGPNKKQRIDAACDNLSINVARPRAWPIALLRTAPRGPRRAHLGARYDYSLFNGRVEAALSGADLVYSSLVYGAAWLVEKVPSFAGPMVWDTQNYEPALWRARAEHWRGARRWAARHQVAVTEHLSKSVYRRVSLMMTCSDADSAAYAELLGGRGDRVAVVPNGVDVGLWARASRDVSPIPGRLVIFGSLAQDMTARGVEWFLSEVWPEVAARTSGAEVVVAGRAPGKRLRDAVRRAPRAELCPDPEAIELVAATGSVIAIPQLYGTGSKLKTLAALSLNRPVLTTSAGVVGLVAPDSDALCVANSASAWINTLVEWTEGRLPTADNSQMVEQYDWSSVAARMGELVAGAPPRSGAP